VSRLELVELKKQIDKLLEKGYIRPAPRLGPPLSHPVLEGKPNTNHVRARISNSRTQQLHNMDIITQCSNSIKKGEIIVDYIMMSETST
jgi:hypothetical protein